MTSHRTAIVILTAAALAVAIPHAADAQRRAVARRGAVRPAPSRSVVVVGRVGFPRYQIFGPWYPWGYPFGYPWGPYGYPPYYGYPVTDTLTSSLRIEATPRDAEVFVDGSSAGVVDNFDGVFQRLRLSPGRHEIALYLEGYRTISRSMYFGPGSSQTLRLTMERLPAGQTAEVPQPPPPPVMAQPPAGPPDAGPEAVAPPPPSSGPDEPNAGPRVLRRGGERRESQDVTRFGTLSVRVQPAGADILIDGERWSGPTDQDHVVIRLAEGRHHVTVRKGGFATYDEEVLILPGRTLSVNVSLLQGS
jgi:hypothetical protein